MLPLYACCMHLKIKVERQSNLTNTKIYVEYTPMFPDVFSFINLILGTSMSLLFEMNELP